MVVVVLVVVVIVVVVEDTVDSCVFCIILSAFALYNHISSTNFSSSLLYCPLFTSLASPSFSFPLMLRISFSMTS